MTNKEFEQKVKEMFPVAEIYIETGKKENGNSYIDVFINKIRYGSESSLNESYIQSSYEDCMNVLLRDKEKILQEIYD